MIKQYIGLLNPVKIYPRNNLRTSITIISKTINNNNQQQQQYFINASDYNRSSYVSRRSLSTRANIPFKLLPLNHKRALSTQPSSLTKPENNLSSVFGPTSTPLDERPLGEFWDALVEQYPNSPALVCRHENFNLHSKTYIGNENWKEEDCLRFSFKEMGEKVDQLARGLMSLGFNKGDRVGVYAGNSSAYALLQWATAKVGIILVCINPASRGPELLAALNLSGCSALFIPPSLKKSAHIEMLHTLLPTLKVTSSSARSSKVKELSDSACPSLRRILMIDNTELGAKGFEEMLEREGLGGMDARTVLDYTPAVGERRLKYEKSLNTDVANIQFSSGTTGLPKAIPLTSRNLLNNGILIGDGMDLRPPCPEEGWGGERLCNVPPMYHCFGIVLGNLAIWTHGGCIIFPAEVFSPSQTLRAVVKEKCTALHGVPTMFTAELALLDALEEGKFVENLSDLGQLDFSHMRTGIAAGSPVPAEIMRKLTERMNLRECIIVYGQTETSPGTVLSKTQDSLDLRCRTVGQVMGHSNIRLVDPSHELYPSPSTPSIPLNTSGEIWSAGYALMPGYWNNELETTKAMFYDEAGLRWMKTGDQGSMDENGFITITGRIKDIIIRGGENLFPTVIEARSLNLEGVAAVSVVAVPDKKFGEVVGAFVERSASAAGLALKGQDLTDHITKIMSHQSAPTWVWFLGEHGVDVEFPKTASGKVRKVELRDWALELVKKEVGRIKP